MDKIQDGDYNLHDVISKFHSGSIRELVRVWRFVHIKFLIPKSSALSSKSMAIQPLCEFELKVFAITSAFELPAYAIPVELIL